MFLFDLMFWVHIAPFLLCFMISLRFARLAKASPLIAGGFGAVLAVNVGSRLVNMLLTRLYQPSAPRFPLELPSQLVTASSIMSAAGTLAWLLIAYGLYATFQELHRKLALVHLSQQAGWNTQATLISLQNSPPQNAYSQQTIREEAHASAFAPPAPPVPAAPPISTFRAPDVACSEQPAPLVALGSARQ